MKKSTLLLMAFLCAIASFAQSPQAFKYQAIARNNAGEILGNQLVSFRISILQGSAAGAAVYSETHQTTTSQFGLANLTIGSGSVVSGVFADIAWSSNSYFLKIEMDATGGTAYQFLGTSQLLSVPYSMHSASTSDNTRWIRNVNNLYYLDGKVGIGTTTPIYALDLNLSSGPSFMNLKTNSGYAGLILDKSGTTNNGYLIYNTGGVSKWFAGLIGDDNYAISTSYSSPDGKFYIENTGDVGIGTTSPDANLEVADATGQAEIRINRPSTNFAGVLGFYTGTSGEWNFTTASGNHNMAIYRGNGNTTGNLGLMHSGGLVGIGTLTPGAELEVTTSSGQAEIRITRPSSSYAGVLSFYTGAASEWNLSTASGNDNMLISRGSGNTTGNLGLLSTGGKVGVGTSSPYRTFEVSGPWQTARISSSSAGATLEFVSETQNDWAITTWNGFMAFLHSSNDFSTKTDEYYITTTSFYPYSSNTKSLGAASNRWSDVYSVDGFFSGNVGIGTTALATGYKLSVDGKIICEELRVDMSEGWPDYVFAKEYKLMPVKELDSFIQSNGHLPNIPAADEIHESGLEVGEMQRLMMEKIEELSLYIIEQQKEIDELKCMINKNQE